MTKSGFPLRGWLLALPLLLLSAFAVWTVGAATTTATVPTGPISTTVNANFTMTNYTAYPAGINSLSAPDVPPIIMLVMSRDEQLFNKAYSDYTDLNNDGTLDTTYLDSFTYNGYFDPNICYSYGTMPAGGTGFYAAVSVSVNIHECPSGQSYWSGNFLNWLAMSRLDIVRWTLYGGMRQIDTATATVLERAEIPVDLHSWAKVYSGSDIANLAPFSGTTTFCNTSGGSVSATSMTAATASNGNISSTGKWGSFGTSLSGVQSTPFIRTASGAWNDWAANAKVQCFNRTGNADGNNVDSAKPSGTITDYVARVQVCQTSSGSSSTPIESFCVLENTGTMKPEGLLQKYSKGDAYEKHFGLVTASAVNARGPGQLRRNVGMLAGNGGNTTYCQTDSTGAGDDDEFDSNTGQFCYKELAQTPSEGIVYSIDRFQITGWQYESSGSDGGYYDYGDSPSSTGCYGPSNPWGARGYQLLKTTTMCPDFGNPIAAVYATALQYIQGQSTPSTADTTGPLPNPAWVDPYGTPAGSSTQRNAECAACSIVLISSGLNTFDAPGTQTLPTVNNLSSNLSTLMSSIQQGEALSGNYLLSTYYTGGTDTGTLTVGGATTSDVAACSSAALSSLNSLVGICNGAPGQQGGYLFAGLSLGAWNASGLAPIRTDGHVPGTFQIKTFAVALSDNLPSFSIPVGTSGTISLAPSCRASADGTNYTTCFIGSVQIGAQSDYNLSATKTGWNTYGLIPTTAYPNVGSFYFVWEDSQYGSDHDQDANNLISYCVGASCNMPSVVNTASGAVAICDPAVFNGSISSKTSTTTYSTTTSSQACNANGTLSFTPGANDVVIRNQLVAYSSGDMFVGYEISGTGTTDGLHEMFMSNGGGSSSATQNGAAFNCNLMGGVLAGFSNYPGDCKSAPVVDHYTLGTTSPVQPLQTPLWYGAKYSGFTGTLPSLPAGQDPSNYFFARNAGQLKAQLDSVFQSITSLAANNFGNATTPSSSNDVQGNGLAYQVQYYMQRNGINWTGDLLALWTDANGYQREGTMSQTGNEELDASANYVVNGPDSSQGALPGAMAQYRCKASTALLQALQAGGFTPVGNSACTEVNAVSNPLVPAWDADTLLNAYYDPTTTAGQSAITNVSVQRSYTADSGSGSGVGSRYIFTYLPTVSSGNWAPNGGNATGTITNGIQTDFVWNDSSCSSTGVYTPGAQAGFCGTYSTANKVRSGNYSLLNEQSPTLAKELVNWVRGVESPDYRSRTTVSSTSANTFRLGDIIDSSPMIVGTPAESYDTLYNSASYGAFRLNYSNRRQMVYVGGNDGMLHAFNGGFYVPSQTVATVGGSSTGNADPTVYRQLPSGLGLSSGDTNHTYGNNWTLGQEVWAFIPGNLLPHLRWMADKNYTHVFYVDGSPVASDVQLWGTGSSTSCQAGQAAAADIDASGHVCGWGTVIVVPFRLGGGYIQVDTVGSDNNATANLQTSNPAYVVLDVTDPEQPPTVLGEITTAAFNATTSTYTTGTFTTSAPSFVAHRESDGVTHFLLAIGSGPGDDGGPIPSTNSTGIPNNVLWCGTTQTAGNKVVQAPCGGNLSVSVYDLAQMVKGTSTPVTTLTGPANSFAGDMVASDFNLNFSDEAVYFGVVTNPTTTTTNGTYTDKTPFSGALYKLDMNTGPTTLKGQPSTPDVSDPSTWALKLVINNGQPVTIRPTLATDSSGRPMIYFGTGRSYTQDDDSGSSLQGTQQQYIYGVADVSLMTGLPANCVTLPVSTSSLFNASTTTLGTTGTITVGTGSGLSNASSVTDINQLTTALTSVDTTATDANYQCYLYNGWSYALTPGVLPSTTGGTPTAAQAQPSERVVSSQVLYSQILLTPTYIPPGAAAIAAANSTVCNPVPVPGTSNLYGMDYLTGTANVAMAGSFGSVKGIVSTSVGLGSGLASSPVLHTGNGTVTAALGLSGGTTLQNVSGMTTPNNAEISWREPATNQ
ncbi:hypothetical protein [Dyella sp. C9]|uniref:hypothetical protein n=1 Tax=Dyella sp. C9 TaxID=2202154 RepID=UPI000DEF343A|nr:hypothetical protein [Dyella sp. C9]